MKMSERVSTAGMLLLNAVETTAGTRPTSGFTKVPEVKSMPNFNPAPATIDSTTLEETEFMTYVEGLKDLGGALEFSANLTDDLDTYWATVLSNYEDAAEEGKAMWWCIYHPKLAKATYFKGKPAPIGFNDASVGSMAETTLYITPSSAPIRETKPTLATGAAMFSAPKATNNKESV